MITTDNYIRFTRVDAVDETDTDALAGPDTPRILTAYTELTGRTVVLRAQGGAGPLKSIVRRPSGAAGDSC
jgi:hypothetical protein